MNDLTKIAFLNKCWSWKIGLSDKLCDLLLKDRIAFEEKPALILNEEELLDKTIRDSKVCWAPVNHWAEGILYNYGLYATQEAGWNFHLGRPEQIQLTAYDKDGFYGWHEDWAPFALGPSIRKVSVIALLSDPKDFEGGKFQIDGDVEIEMERGTVIAFPFFLRHQVTPVTSGKRYSAVCWINGPRIF
jgi:hypothetical protein